MRESYAYLNNAINDLIHCLQGEILKIDQLNESLIVWLHKGDQVRGLVPNHFEAGNLHKMKMRIIQDREDQALRRGCPTLLLTDKNASSQASRPKIRAVNSPKMRELGEEI